MLLLAFLTSCVAEDLAIDNDIKTPTGPERLSETQRFYYSFCLDMAEGVPYTRVEYGSENGDKYDQGFEAGDAKAELQESSIYNLLVIFYDEGGNYLGHSTDRDLVTKKHSEIDKEEEENENGDPDTVGGTEESEGDEDDEKEEEEEEEEEQGPLEDIYWNNLITLSVDTDYNLIDYIDEKKGKISYFVIVNYTNDLLEKKSDGTIAGKLVGSSDPVKLKSLKDLKDIKVTDYNGGGGTILMTTAGFFDEDGKYKFYDTTSEDIKFWNSEEQARQNPFGTVYLERAAAKIRLEKISQIEPVEVLWGTGVYSLTFVPLGWGIEGEEKEEYLVKNNDDLSAYQLNENEDYPDDFYAWMNYNDVPYRTFWAVSPSYTTSTDNTYPSTGTESSGLTLNYNPFKALITNKDEFEDENYDELEKNSIYAFERTFSGQELSSVDIANPYAVPTSFVLTGYYPEALWVRTDEKAGEDVEHPDGTTPDPNTVPETGAKLSFNEKGFYLRYIDIERTDKDSEGKDENDNPIPDPKRYKYRLYREKDDNGKDELLAALLKEQYTLFVKRIVTHYYLDEKELENGKPKVKGENIITYIPVKASTTYFKDKTNKVTGSIADELFGIFNTQTIWNDTGTQKKRTDASNTYTLQLINDNKIQETINKINLGLAKDEKVLEQTLNGEVFWDIANEVLVYGKYNASEEKGEYDELNKDNIAEANQLLQQTLGYAQFYWEGKAFFYSPITHYTGFDAPYSSDNPYKGLFNYETETKDGVTVYKKDSNGKYIPSHKTGDFGVVRNHVYNFSIDKITSIGYGIPGENVIPLPEQRIDHKIYQFDLELKILPWNKFEYYLDI